MLIKGLEGTIDSRSISIAFPDKKSIIIKSSNSLEIMFLIEKLLSNDMTDYYTKKDNDYGITYKSISDKAQLIFNDGLIYSKNQAVFTKGKIPVIHIIRYLTNDKFRSIITGDSSNKANDSIYADLTKYSNIITYTTWQRLVITVNTLLGYEMVSIVSTGNSHSLQFNIVDNYNNWSTQAQKFVYMLVSECFVTPNGANRVLLLPEIEILSKEQQIKLMETLDNIKGHSLLLSDLKVNFNDLSSNSCISIISV